MKIYMVGIFSYFHKALRIFLPILWALPQFLGMFLKKFRTPISRFLTIQLLKIIGYLSFVNFYNVNFCHVHRLGMYVGI